MPSFRVVGPGQAGGSLVVALTAAAAGVDLDDRRCRRILTRPGQASGS